MNKLVAGINFDGNGLAQSINAMQMDMDIMGIFADNISGFDKVGYQRKDVVISSFAQYLGTDALSYNVDDQVGRLEMTQNPLDIALSEKGYFQVQNQDGTIDLTRDGRFKLDKNGNLLTQDNQKVLSSTGKAVIFPVVPDSLNEIKIGLDGKIQVFDKEQRKFTSFAKIGVVSADGSLVASNCVRQGFIENSNVQPETEFAEMLNYRRSFEANRQMFKIQNNKLSTAISKLGQV